MTPAYDRTAYRADVGTINRQWRRRLNALCLGCAAGFAGTSAHAAPQTSVATVIALRPLSIVKLRDLDFGIMVAGGTAGTVVIDPDTDQRTTSGGTVAAGGAPQAAQFYTYGTPTRVLQVTRGPLPVLTRVGGGATMTVDQLTLNGPVTRVVTAAGVIDLRVGGRLQVGANQMSGTYNGTFDITVTYF